MSEEFEESEEFDEEEKLEEDVLEEEGHGSSGTYSAEEEETALPQQRGLSNQTSAFDMLGSNFPEHYATIQQGIEALKKMSVEEDHPMQEKDMSMLLKEDLEATKKRFEYAYETLLEDERRENRLDNQRSLKRAILREKNEIRSQKIEKLRVERAMEELENQKKSRRLQRLAKEDHLIQVMLQETFQLQKQKIVHRAGLRRQEREVQEAALREKLEKAQQFYQDKEDVLRQEIHLEKVQGLKAQREQEQEIRQMELDMKKGFQVRLEQARKQLDEKEEERMFASVAMIQKAFAMLNEDFSKVAV